MNPILLSLFITKCLGFITGMNLFVFKQLYGYLEWVGTLEGDKNNIEDALEVEQIGPFLTFLFSNLLHLLTGTVSSTNSQSQ